MASGSKKLPRRRGGGGTRKALKYAGIGTILFFTIKGLITTSLIVAGLAGLRGCLM